MAQRKTTTRKKDEPKKPTKAEAKVIAELDRKLHIAEADNQASLDPAPSAEPKIPIVTEAVPEPPAATRRTRTPENKHDNTTPGRRRKLRRRLWLVVGLIVLLVGAGWVTIKMLKGEHGTINNVELTQVSTYLSTSSDATDKKQQSSFKEGDPIQVGFRYNEFEQTDQTLVKFVVRNREDNKEAFATSFFQLNPAERWLYVSINNTNLKPAKYTVELQDKNKKVVAKTYYEITAR